MVGAPPAGSSRFLSLGGPLPGSLRGVRALSGASAIARSLTDRRERLVSAVTAVTRCQHRAKTAVTGVIAVSAVIAGFVLLGPSRPLRTVAKGAVPPVTSVLAVTAVTLPIVTPQGGHGPTTAAVIARGPCLL